MAVFENKKFRIPKISASANIINNVIISSEDNPTSKSDHLTAEQEEILLNKIIVQMEKNKFKEAQRKQETNKTEFDYPSSQRHSRRNNNTHGWRNRKQVHSYHDQSAGYSRMPDRGWYNSGWRNAQSNFTTQRNLDSTCATQMLPPHTSAHATSTLDVSELFQKLVQTGLVKTEAKPLINTPKLIESNRIPKEETSAISNQGLSAMKLKRTIHDSLKEITFSNLATLKVRQSNLYTMLYTGMQCSSCGTRFLPEESKEYTQHLDWHFRQNRKAKNNRGTSNRKWYYSMSDWKKYEEVEDLEKKETNFFDQQQAKNCDVEGEKEIPSVPSDHEKNEEFCEACHEKLDQFFNEEKEEWYLRNVIRTDGKTYHPTCYENYQQSFIDRSLDESLIEESVKEISKKSTTAGPDLVITEDETDKSKIKQETMEEENNQYTKSEDDSDVIFIQAAPTMIAVDNQDDDLKDGTHTVETIKVKEKIHLHSEGPKTYSLKPEESKEDRNEDTPLAEDADVILNEVAPIIIVIDDEDEEDAKDVSQTVEMIQIKKECLSATDINWIEPPSSVEEQIPVSMKPALQAVKLKNLPPVNRDTELSALCSIM